VRLRSTTADGLSDLTFTADLVDTLIAVLSAPMSKETRDALAAIADGTTRS